MLKTQMQETLNYQPPDGGGRCHYDDEGWYAGDWKMGMAHGHGVCGSGPRAKDVSEFSGLWQQGFEVNGVCRWASRTTYEGQWLQGKQHGIGVEKRGHWTYKGEWTHGCKGRYGACKSLLSNLRYEGTWTAGVRDGYGVETYPDEGTYHGQWMRGKRHGYGIRQSAPYITTLRSPLKNLPNSTSTSDGSGNQVSIDRDSRMEETRGGFVLQTRCTPVDEPQMRNKKPGLLDRLGRRGLRKSLANEFKIIRQKSTGDLNQGSNFGRPQSAGASSRASSTGGSVRSNASAFSQISSAFSNSSTRRSSEELDEELGSFCSDVDLANDKVTERYAGEWKNDKRSGFGVCERSDGVKYEGEWLNNRKHGYGVTTLPTGVKMEGKYKNNILVNAWKSSKLFSLRNNKIRDKIEASVEAAQRAANTAVQKMETANVRMMSARVRADQADEAAKRAINDAEIAAEAARQYSTESQGTQVVANRQQYNESYPNQNTQTLDKTSNKSTFFGRKATPIQQIQLTQPEPKPQKKFTFFKRKGDSSWRSKSETRNSPSAGFSLFGNSSFKSNQPSRTPADYNPLNTYNQGYESVSNSTLSNPTLRSNPSSSVGRDYEKVLALSPQSYPGVDSKMEISLNVPNAPWSDQFNSNLNSNFNSNVNSMHGRSPSSSKASNAPSLPLSRDSIYNFASQQRNRELNGTAVHSQWSGGGNINPTSNVANSASYEAAQRNQESFNSSMMGHGSYTVESVDSNTIISAWQVKEPQSFDQTRRNEIKAQEREIYCPQPQTNFLNSHNADNLSPNSERIQNFEPLRDRRKSLPSIIKDPPSNSSQASSNPSSRSASRTVQVSSTTPSKTLLGQTPLNIFSSRSTSCHTADNVPTDTYVIENGVRKRVKPVSAGKVTAVPAKVPHYELEASKSLYKRGDLGSLPDVSVISDSEVLPREIVYQMSQQRREELMKQREEMERYYGGNIVLRIEDILEWLWKKKMFMLIFILNLALLYAFLNLLK